MILNYLLRSSRVVVKQCPRDPKIGMQSCFGSNSMVEFDSKIPKNSACPNTYTMYMYKAKFFRASFLCFPPQQITPLSAGMTKYTFVFNSLIEKLESNWMIFPKELDMVITNNILKFQAILYRIKACQTILLTSIFRGLFG